MIRLLILLIAAHAVCDIPLQNPWLSIAKRGEDPCFPAWLALLYHAAIHAGAVMLITNSVECALIEWVVHDVTDTVKCAGKISAKLDQAIHLSYKVLYILLVRGGV